MKDIAIEYNTMDYAIRGLIEIIVSGRDIMELLDELKERGYNVVMNGEYEFSCRIPKVILNELGNRF